jgi:hypothetical protein
MEPRDRLLAPDILEYRIAFCVCCSLNENVVFALVANDVLAAEIDRILATQSNETFANGWQYAM